MIAFWVIVLVGLVWIAYSVGSDRRNPPMAKCYGCGGDGVIRPHGVPIICKGCDGDGWVEA